MPLHNIPLDPDCSLAVAHTMALRGANGLALADFARRHRAACPQCLDYGARRLQGLLTPVTTPAVVQITVKVRP